MGSLDHCSSVLNNKLSRAARNHHYDRNAERTLIAQELHDTLLQGFLSLSMQLHDAVDHLPEHLSASRT